MIINIKYTFLIMTLKKINICINSTIFFNTNSMEYYEKIEKNNSKENKSIDNSSKYKYLEKRLKEIIKNDKNNKKNDNNDNNISNASKIRKNIINYYYNVNNIENNLNLENIKFNIIKKIKYIFKEDLIDICDDLIIICDFFNLKNIINCINEYKNIFINNNIYKNDFEILKIVEKINIKINNLKNKKIKNQISDIDFELVSILKDLNKILEIIKN